MSQQCTNAQNTCHLAPLYEFFWKSWYMLIRIVFPQQLILHTAEFLNKFINVYNVFYLVFLLFSSWVAICAGNNWHVWLCCWVKPPIKWINNTIRTWDDYLIFLNFFLFIVYVDISLCTCSKKEKKVLLFGTGGRLLMQNVCS